MGDKLLRTIYVCQACGKTAPEPVRFRDVSCVVDAVECLMDSLEYDKNGLVTKAEATPTNKLNK